MFKGDLIITQEFKNGDKIVKEYKNAISDGLAYSMANLLAATGSIDPVDYSIGYMQLGQGSLSGYLPFRTLNTNFYQLNSPLSESDYGSDSYFSPVNLFQVVNSNGNFESSVSIGLTSGTFIPLNNNNISLFQEKTRVRIVIDEEMANGISISEIGIFLKNPLGYSEQDAPVLMAYKTFTPITKTSEFSIVIDWVITLVDVGQQQFLSNGGGTDYTEELVTLLSGTGNSVNQGTGALLSDRFSMLVPSAYTANSPLLVYFRNFGDANVGFSTISAIATELNNRGWFAVAPLGNADLYPHSLANIYNINSIDSIKNVRTIVNYMLTNYPIDPARIYFYGFGTGGGAAMSVASLMTDLNHWYPAALICHDGILSNRFTWWKYAASGLSSLGGVYGFAGEPHPGINEVTFSAAPITYNPPENPSLQTPAKAATFWFTSSFPARVGYTTIPAELASNSADGADWLNVSAYTPDLRPFLFLETSPIDFNLITSSDLWVSTCTLLNLTHVPMFVQFDTNSPSGSLVTLPNTILSSYMTTGQYRSLFNYQLSTTNNGIFSPSTLNITSAFEFLNSKRKTAVLSGITCVTRNGMYWGLSCNSYVADNAESWTGWYYRDLSGTSLSAAPDTIAYTAGFAFVWWSRDLVNNQLNVSSAWLIKDNNQSNMYLDVTGMGFTAGTSAVPFVVLTNYLSTKPPSHFTYLESYNYPHPWVDAGILSSIDQSRRITLLDHPQGDILTYVSALPDGTMDYIEYPVYNKNPNNGNRLIGGAGTQYQWRILPNYPSISGGITVAFQEIANPVTIVLLRRGKFKIIKAPG